MANELSGPHLQAALLCEKVLSEKDNVLSLIRIVDRFTRPRPGSPNVPAIASQVQAMLVIMFKGGGFGTGKCRLKIRIYKDHTPDTNLALMENDLFFEGGPDRGMNIISPLVFMPDEEGLYWIDVLIFDQTATRIPFRVLFVEIPQTQAPPMPSPE